MKKARRALSIALVLAMTLSTVVVNDAVSSAAAKATLKTKKVNLKVGKTATIKIAKKNKRAVYKFVSSKKSIAAVSKKGVITAKKQGKATITVKETLNKKTRKLGKVNVTVKKVEDTTTVVPTQTPVTQIATQSPVVNATLTPVVTNTPTKVPEQTATPAPTSTPASPYVPISELRMDAYDAPAGYRDNVKDNNGTKTKIEYPSTVIKEGEEVMRKANVCLPKDYDAEDTDKRYPVIYMCHGIFGNEDSVTDAAYVYWNAMAEEEAEEAILVFPSCCANETSGSVGENGGFNLTHYSAYDNFLNDFKECLKPYIDANYNTLPERENTAICGFSMGGRVTLHLGFSLQDTFRYIGAFCPAPGIFDFTDNGVTGPGLFEKEDFKIKDEYKDDTLVMLFKGENDGVVKNFPQEYEDVLVENEVPHVYYLGKGMKSDGTAGSGGHDGDLYDFGFYNFITRIFKKK